MVAQPTPFRQFSDDRAAVMREAKRLITEGILAEGQVSMPDCADLLADWIRSHDEVLSALIYPIAYATIQQAVAGTRGPDGTFLIAAGSQITTPAAIGKHGRLQFSKFDRWLEHVGKSEKRLMALNKQELIVAATEREGRAAAESHRATFLRYIADRLADGEVVADRFTAAQLEEIDAVL